MTKFITVLLNLSWLILLSSSLTQAQTQITLTYLEVQLWPEFDRPETLIIYQGDVADNLTLPVTLEFILPAEVTEMNAVAIFDPQGRLVNHPHTLTPIDQGQRLTFILTEPSFQLEYYDPTILSQSDSTRTLSYNLVTPYQISTLDMQVQKPLGADQINLDPSPADEITGADGLVYFTYTYQDIVPQQVLGLNGNYTKTDDSLTAERLNANSPVVNPVEVEPVTTNQSSTLPFILIGGGLVLLLVASVVWWRQNQRIIEPTTRRRQPRPRHKNESRKKQSATTNPSLPSKSAEAKFCHQCGTPYRSQAQFCHQCGAAKR